MNPLLQTDFYKPHHNRMYPDGMTFLESNFTPRKSRLPGISEVVVFGLQHFLKQTLIHQFNTHFFGVRKELILQEYSRHIPIDTQHISDLWDLGYLPIEIKALPEGSKCPIGVPLLTINNTHPKFAWLVNYLETLISCSLWQGITSATIAYEYKKLLTKYALETTGSDEFVQWQGHDFSMRGMSSVESAILSGMGHLTSFTGTDTIPAIYQLEQSYNATGLVGASVPATEHSVMCMGTKEGEIDTIRRLLNLYPTGILSVVLDTWDIWRVHTEYLPQLKSEILSRDGKLVIRPDSGNPVDIICGSIKSGTEKDIDDEIGDFHINGQYYKDQGFTNNHRWESQHVKATSKDFKPSEIGVIELLWDTFGGTVNSQGYKVLDSHIGAIYGDSITLERAEQICERLKAKGFASTNIVFGIGSYTYQYNTRDTFGFAMKATYGEVKTKPCMCPEKAIQCNECVESREIFKAPVTDSGEKKSAKGLLKVVKRDCKLVLLQQVTKGDQLQEDNELKVVFRNSEMVNPVRFETIRERLKL